MVVVVEKGEIFFCVDNTEEVTSPKNASQVSLCVRVRRGCTRMSCLKPCRSVICSSIEEWRQCRLLRRSTTSSLSRPEVD